MGKAGRGWQPDRTTREADYSWQFWPGPWRQSAEQWGWRSQEQTSAFPAYDKVKGQGKQVTLSLCGRGARTHLRSRRDSRVDRQLEAAIKAP